MTVYTITKWSSVKTGSTGHVKIALVIIFLGLTLPSVYTHGQPCTQLELKIGAGGLPGAGCKMRMCGSADA